VSVTASRNITLIIRLLVQWDAAPTVMVTLHAGRNDLEEAVMRVHGPTGITFRLPDTALLDDSLGNSSMYFDNLQVIR
jgi:hypothetical protein